MNVYYHGNMIIVFSLHSSFKFSISAWSNEMLVLILLMVFYEYIVESICYFC